MMIAHIPVILLAEDNPKDVDLTSRALGGEQPRQPARRRAATGWRPSSTCVAREPSPIVSPSEPAVVLLDIKMPRKDGLEVLREIRGDPKLRRLPVVILTSSREEQDLIAGYDLGVNAYVVKPVDFDELHQGSQAARGVLGAHQRAPARGRK